MAGFDSEMGPCCHCSWSSYSPFLGEKENLVIYLSHSVWKLCIGLSRFPPVASVYYLREDLVTYMGWLIHTNVPLKKTKKKKMALKMTTIFVCGS